MYYHQQATQESLGLFPFRSPTFTSHRTDPMARARGKCLLNVPYLLLNHNYNKIVKSDWLSTALISALIGQLNRTVRVMRK